MSSRAQLCENEVKTTVVNVALKKLAVKSVHFTILSSLPFSNLSFSGPQIATRLIALTCDATGVKILLWF